MGNPHDAVEMMQCVLPGWVIKDTVASSLFSLAPLTLGEATPRVVKTLKQPLGEVCVMKGWGLQPTATWAVTLKGVPPASSKAFNDMTDAPADILTAIQEN